MVTEPHFQLTTKDHAILQAMLERHKGPHDGFARLLERKLRASSIFFRDDIPVGVVTLNTRLTYRVNGQLAGPHLIVQSEGDDLPDYALSIHTMRGLALLGMAQRSTFAIEMGEGMVEELRVEDVLSQPEAEARIRETTRGLAQGNNANRAHNVIRLQRKASASVMWGPDDDDPGPFAA